MRIIAHQDDIAEGMDALIRRDHRLRPVAEMAGLPPLRRSEGGFSGLCGIIVAQQLSVASADAIWGRVRTRLSPLTPRTVLQAEEPDFRACGLSKPKIRTLRAIAEAVDSGLLEIETLHELPADAAHANLTQVKGIGPWTADIYLMFCLGHADAFAAGDLALQEAVRLAFGLENRPSASELAETAEIWRPWRAVAARLLWAYYRVAKGREGIA
ncbi:MAG TPA: DNA-3-methyladenine glycosylase [Beijerinckiaceae bacterium]|nr:DNA-3-methyladenine glycosylase [Beijerinckiaceae bacterium]